MHHTAMHHTAMQPIFYWTGFLFWVVVIVAVLFLVLVPTVIALAKAASLTRFLVRYYKRRTPEVVSFKETWKSFWFHFREFWKDFWKDWDDDPEFILMKDGSEWSGVGKWTLVDPKPKDEAAEPEGVLNE